MSILPALRQVIDDSISLDDRGGVAAIGRLSIPFILSLVALDTYARHNLQPDDWTMVGHALGLAMSIKLMEFLWTGVLGLRIDVGSDEEE